MSKYIIVTVIYLIIVYKYALVNKYVIGILIFVKFLCSLIKYPGLPIFCRWPMPLYMYFMKCRPFVSKAIVSYRLILCGTRRPDTILYNPAEILSTYVHILDAAGLLTDGVPVACHLKAFVT